MHRYSFGKVFRVHTDASKNVLKKNWPSQLSLQRHKRNTNQYHIVKQHIVCNHFVTTAPFLGVVLRVFLDELVSK